MQFISVAEGFHIGYIDEIKFEDRYVIMFFRILIDEIILYIAF